MICFNGIETIQIAAGAESASGVFSDPASVGASQVMVDNEGIYTVYASVGGDATVPSETPARGCVPVMPMTSKILIKASGESTVSVVTASGTSKVNITSGQGF